MIRNNPDAREQDCFFVFDNILGDSEWARRIRHRVIQFARQRFSVLVTGPPGTGKRLIAHSLHEHGPRRGSPFIPVDCALLSGNLFGGQLFGQSYQETTTLGCFRAAAGGTLYLANADLLDRDAQGELLETLNTRAVVPKGTTETHPLADVRVIAGSRNNLEEAVRQGRFRPELYQRLSVMSFETIPLIERRQDIEPIANHLVARLSFERGFAHKLLATDAVELLKARKWEEGNVSELSDVLDDAVCRSKTQLIEPSDLRLSVDDSESEWMTLADAEAKHVRDTLALTGGDFQRTAKLLGVDEAELRRKAAKLRSQGS